MNPVTLKKNKIFYLILLIIFLIPWFNTEIGDSLKAAKVSQEDLSFYEINPCKVSLVEFLISNKEAIFQDHYYFRFNNYSSILCFGKISGATLLNSGFYISIGTNNLVNLFLQGSIWLLLIGLIKKNKDLLFQGSMNSNSFKIKHFSSLLFTTLIFTF